MPDINVVSTGTHGRGQTYFDREITEERYERAQENNGYLTKEDSEKVLTDSERLGYGASASSVYELDGHYYVRCSRWNNCD
jgi:hypothetical protein